MPSNVTSRSWESGKETGARTKHSNDGSTPDHDQPPSQNSNNYSTNSSTTTTLSATTAHYRSTRHPTPSKTNKDHWRLRNDKV